MITVPGMSITPGVDTPSPSPYQSPFVSAVAALKVISEQYERTRVDVRDGSKELHLKRHESAVTLGRQMAEALTSELGPFVANMVLAEAHADTAVVSHPQCSFTVSSAGVAGIEFTPMNLSLDDLLRRLIQLQAEMEAVKKTHNVHALNEVQERMEDAVERTALVIAGQLHRASYRLDPSYLWDVVETAAAQVYADVQAIQGLAA